MALWTAKPSTQAWAGDRTQRASSTCVAECFPSDDPGKRGTSFLLRAALHSIKTFFERETALSAAICMSGCVKSNVRSNVLDQGLRCGCCH